MQIQTYSKQSFTFRKDKKPNLKHPQETKFRDPKRKSVLY